MEKSINRRMPNNARKKKISAAKIRCSFPNVVILAIDATSNELKLKDAQRKDKP
ncbi:MAG: hypothetical protein KAX39_03865 [candidate division Zixibacteria bacterium]|nr:hypothetical protein [candidate division Zixibacteria bacterium]